MLVLHPVLLGLDAPVPVVGVLDWTAHLATAVILLANMPVALRGPVVAAALAASVLIDLDHIPQYLGSDVLTEGTARPYGHTLTAALIAALVAVLLRGRGREIAVGVALGIVVHLSRDIATGGGISPLWPISDDVARIPFWLETAFLGAVAARAWYLARELPQVTEDPTGTLRR